MSVKRAALLGLALVAMTGRPAAAQDLRDRFNARVSLSALYLHETQDDPDDTQRIAGPLSLAYGDLRVVLDARRLPGRFELHLDGRLRLTGNFSTADADRGAEQTTARGYLGGREYQLTELWARGRWTKVDLAFGRQLVVEADAMRLDGLRLFVHLHKRWELSLYGGGYPDPYSRSLTTDYVSSGLAFAGGASVRYSYDKLSGSFSANAAYLGGTDDGGPLDPTTGGSNPQPEQLRAYLTWNNFWRPLRFLDLYHDLVVDVAGAAGAQLTRLNVFVAVHVTRSITLRLGYDHLSSIAIEMYLSRLLANRSEFLPGAIENNLTLSRTARDEGRATLEAALGKTILSLEGRVRRRVLVTPSNDPQFVYAAGTDRAGSQIAPTLGYDATLAIRDRGSLAGLRPSLWATYLSDYRARNVFVGLGLGRDFLRDRLAVDFAFTYASTRDEPEVEPGLCARTATLLPTALESCFGTRKGHNLQPGLTLGGAPWKHWYAFVDYRAGIALSETSPFVVTHVLLGRIEARY